jgi:two-component system phosphoglycerate transport system response regulator PgtA
MLSNNCSILLIDDDADVLDAYTQLLEQAGYHVSACNNPFDAREQVPKDWPGIVLSDVCMPGCSGIDLMTVFHQDDDLLPILLITGHGDVPMAVEAVKKGAWDFLQKPIDPGKLLTLVGAALRQRQSVIARRQYCQQKLQVELIGRSQWTVRYRQRLQQLAETDIAVWLYGEPGTGRMTGARYLHQLGRHAEGPFIACELTPANAHTLNELIAQAQGGTLVLSHPEHLTHEQQHQLVQLQSHEKRPFRLIGIGSASLVELAASSQIVAELYYCFAMTQIGCQPLSKRPDDIEPLFHHYYTVAGHNIDFNIGIAIHKSGHDRRKQKICRFNGGIDADTTGRGIAIPVKRFKRAFYGVERLKNRLNQFLTSCRRGDALGRAIKQANPEPGFQPLQGMTQR